MAIEIERKFLVKTEHLPVLNPANSRVFVQGYLSFKPSVRIRRTSTDAWITVKGEGTIARSEFEYQIPQKDAAEMLSMCLAQLSKIRHIVDYMGQKWEVDEFIGPHMGLWLAEIELNEPNQSLFFPEWVGLEVTEDPRYTNGALARAGQIP